MYWRLDPFFSMDKIKGRHNVTIVFTDIVWRIYTVTGAKLARPQSMFITYNNDCCWFLRAIDSSSPHSWFLSLRPNEMLSLCQGTDSHVGECGYDLRRQDKRLQPFGLLLPKGTWLHVLNPCHNLSRLHFVLFMCIHLCLCLCTFSCTELRSG